MRVLVVCLGVLAASLAGACRFDPVLTLEPDGGRDVVGSEGNPRCGNGIAEAGEECDGTDLRGASCESLGLRGGSLGCAQDCTYDTSGCGPSTECGNGVKEEGEACDDGNHDPGDGCSPDCAVEPGWECGQQGGASVCVPVCGDGLVRGDEECDDGGQEDGDGCASTCRLEPFHACTGEPSTCVCRVTVDGSAAQPGDGSSWAEPLKDLQEGIDKAASLVDQWNLTGCEVWVAAGSYCPYVDSVDDSYELPAGVTVRGGFCGGESSPEERPAVPLGPCTVSLDATSTDGVLVRSLVAPSDTGDATLDGLVLAGAWAGAVHVPAGVRLYVARCRFENNTAGSGGAMIVEADGTAELTDATFVANTASGGNGGAILVRRGGHLHVQEVVFEDNAASDIFTYLAKGGALYVAGEARASGVVFRYNSATGDGGAVYVGPGAKFSAFWARFELNRTDSGGGAVSAQSGSHVRLVDAVFSQNHATLGAAIRVESGGAKATVDLERCVFEGNDARRHGAGVYVSNSGSAKADVLIGNSLFVHNVARDGTTGASAIHCESGADLRVTNCTIADNQAMGSGTQTVYCGVWVGSWCHALVSNSILWNAQCAELKLVDSGTASLEVRYSDVEGDVPPSVQATGVIHDSPGFVDPAGGDYRLAPDSVCVDSADEQIAGDKDLDRNPRKVDLPGVGHDGMFIVDMGAYERQQ